MPKSECKQYVPGPGVSVVNVNGVAVDSFGLNVLHKLDWNLDKKYVPVFEIAG